MNYICLRYIIWQTISINTIHIKYPNMCGCVLLYLCVCIFIYDMTAGKENRLISIYWFLMYWSSIFIDYIYMIDNIFFFISPYMWDGKNILIMLMFLTLWFQTAKISLDKLAIICSRLKESFWWKENAPICCSYSTDLSIHQNITR